MHENVSNCRTDAAGYKKQVTSAVSAVRAADK
jgi:hypothetical protein